jgi:hypothetical protein
MSNCVRDTATGPVRAGEDCGSLVRKDFRGTPYLLETSPGQGRLLLPEQLPDPGFCQVKQSFQG